MDPHDPSNLGDEIEDWLRIATTAQRIAAPVDLVDLPGIGPALIVAIVGWSNRIAIVTLQPYTGDGHFAPRQLLLRDDTGHLYPWGGAGGSGAGSGHMVFVHSYEGAVHEDATELYLCTLPFDEAIKHTAADPLPPHVVVRVDRG